MQGMQRKRVLRDHGRQGTMHEVPTSEGGARGPFRLRLRHGHMRVLPSSKRLLRRRHNVRLPFSKAPCKQQPPPTPPDMCPGIVEKLRGSRQWIPLRFRRVCLKFSTRLFFFLRRRIGDDHTLHQRSVRRRWDSCNVGRVSEMPCLVSSTIF